MSAPHSPNIRELAARCGVSRTTVSMALRNDPRVAKATKEKIQRAAEAAGYQKNLLVSALMTHVRSRRVKFSGDVIAYLTSCPAEDDWLRMPSLAEGYAAAQRKAQQMGLRLDPIWLGNAGTQSGRAARILRARGIRGSVITPIVTNDPTMEFFWDEHPVVAWGFCLNGMELTRVADSNFDGMALAYEKLRQHGHRRIGLVLQKLQIQTLTNLWLGSFQASQFFRGGDKLAPLILDDPYDPRVFYKWLEKNKPDAIIGTFPNRVLQWIIDRGVAVPDELSYVNLDMDHVTLGRMAGIGQDHASIAEMAIELLASKLVHNDFGLPVIPSVTTIKGKWIDGPTVRNR